MKLTPIDIQQQQFRHTFRGLDPREVDGFLELVAQQLGDSARTNTELKTEVRHVKRELEEHRQREATLKEAMLTAQRAIDEIREQAEKQAELIITEADLRAEKLVMTAHKRVSKILDDIQDLKRQRARAVTELRGIINTHDKMLSMHEEQLASPEEQKAEASLAVLDRVRAPRPPRLDELAG